MGKRARKGGIANVAVREAQKVIANRNDPAKRIGQAVYLAIRDAPMSGVLAPELHGPIEVAAVMAAPTIARRMGITNADEDTLLDIRAYLIAGFASMAYELDPEHFEKWRAQWNQREHAAKEAQAKLAELSTEGQAS